MKKTAVILAILFAVTNIVSLVAGAESAFQKANDYFGAIGKNPPVAPAKNTFFQKASDSIDYIGTKGSVPADSNTQFQKISNQIGTWDDSSAQAKKRSLRGNPQEVARRRGTQ